MTATDTLRQLLDERGVGWSTATKSTRYTAWLTEHGLAQAADYGEDGSIVSVIHRCTPEQAVDATLGRGTCKVVSKPCDMWECECGKTWWHGGAPSYCPSCGRRVER